VSKRPMAGTGMMSRVRGLGGYLRDRPIWVKLGLIMMVPTIATIAVGFGALLTNIGAATDADRARTLASLAADSGAVVHGLQNERAAAAMVLSTPSTSDTVIKNFQTTYKSLFEGTDKAIQTYREHRNTLTGLPDAFVGQLQSIDAGLGSLANLRSTVASNNNITLNDALLRYGGLINNLLSIRGSSAQLAGDAALSYEIQAGAALARDKEWLSQERVVGLQVLLTKDLEISTQQTFIGTLTAQGQALQDFANVATPDQLTLLHQIYTGPDVRETQVFEEDLHVWRPGEAPPDGLAGPDEWDSVFAGSSDLLRQVEQKIDQQTLRDSAALHNRVQSQVLVEAGLLLSLVLVAVLIAWFVARSMNRSLRELRHGALAVAEHGLPQAVARLRDPALSSQMSPHEVALHIAEPLPVRSRDEFGQVTEAFNAVHLEAVRTAAEQASLRSSVSTMFVNLARRSQILVDRLIGHLDRLERGEEDPDRLAELFQLDHLATRMRRNDENLLVLAGADSTRVQREPAALIDVLRAAQSEVEHYTRIEFGVIDRDIEVASHAVNDLVHLVAELFDNATAFSPPDSSVMVEARRVGDRAVLYVEDHGIGISAEQLADLNERLASPPEVDVAVSRMMGLVVVARLANRHGVRVELRPAQERGTIADVLLPISVLMHRGLGARGAGPGPLAPATEPPSRPRSPVPAQRPPGGGGPLALESGPAGAGYAGGNTGSFSNGGGYGNGRHPAPGSLASSGIGGLAGSGPEAYSGAPGAPSGARNLPAWSDLTGAVNGTHPGGPDLFSPRRPDGGGEPLPQRRAGENRPQEPGVPPRDQPRPPVPRQQPAAPAAPEALRDPGRDSRGAGAPPPAGRADPVDADIIEDRPAGPRPAPSGPRGGALPPAPAPPPPPSARLPPAWPPIPADARPAGEDASPAVPEELAAALDITSEIARYRGDQPGHGPEGAGGDRPAVPQAYNPPPLAPQPPAPGAARSAPAAPPTPNGSAESRRMAPYPDETMELPIFRELESAWFRSRPATESGPTGAGREESAAPAANGHPASTNGSAAEAPPAPAAGPAPSQPTPTRPAQPWRAETAAEQPGARPVVSDLPWQSPADDGWSAARAASQPEVAAVTDAGLPKRVPMAQLVPGGVDRQAVNVERQPVNANRRSPEQVRGLLSAYHRGVQRGRTRNGDEVKPPETSTPTGHSHGGKELE
jgi:signal transduction histidine kinase